MIPQSNARMTFLLIATAIVGANSAVFLLLSLSQVWLAMAPLLSVLGVRPVNLSRRDG
jgi:hypothetical protein